MGLMEFHCHDIDDENDYQDLSMISKKLESGDSRVIFQNLNVLMNCCFLSDPPSCFDKKIIHLLYFPDYLVKSHALRLLSLLVESKSSIYEIIPKHIKILLKDQNFILPTVRFLSQIMTSSLFHQLFPQIHELLNMEYSILIQRYLLNIIYKAYCNDHKLFFLLMSQIQRFIYNTSLKYSALTILSEVLMDFIYSPQFTSNNNNIENNNNNENHNNNRIKNTHNNYTIINSYFATMLFNFFTPLILSLSQLNSPIFNSSVCKCLTLASIYLNGLPKEIQEKIIGKILSIINDDTPLMNLYSFSILLSHFSMDIRNINFVFDKIFNALSNYLNAHYSSKQLETLSELQNARSSIVFKKKDKKIDIIQYLSYSEQDIYFIVLKSYNALSHYALPFFSGVIKDEKDPQIQLLLFNLKLDHNVSNKILNISYNNFLINVLLDNSPLSIVLEAAKLAENQGFSYAIFLFDFYLQTIQYVSNHKSSRFSKNKKRRTKSELLNFDSNSKISRKPFHRLSFSSTISKDNISLFKEQNSRLLDLLGILFLRIQDDNLLNNLMEYSRGKIHYFTDDKSGKFLASLYSERSNHEEDVNLFIKTLENFNSDEFKCFIMSELINFKLNINFPFNPSLIKVLSKFTSSSFRDIRLLSCQLMYLCEENI